MLSAVLGTVKRLLLEDSTPSNHKSPINSPDIFDKTRNNDKHNLSSSYDGLQYGQSVEDITEEDSKETNSFRGKVTDLLYGYGLINNDVYFTYDCVIGGEQPDLGASVDVIAVRDHNKGGWKAKSVTLIVSLEWDTDNDSSNIMTKIDHLIGTITKVTQDSGLPPAMGGFTDANIGDRGINRRRHVGVHCTIRVGRYNNVR